MTQALCWGILGPGRIAHKFAAGLKESAEAHLLAVASRDAERGRAAAEAMGAVRSYGSYAEILSDTDVEAVYIALPNSLHAEWAIRAAQAGKHVLCEKPLAPTTAEAESMFEAARANNVWMMEAFMYRFHPRTLQLQEIVGQGLIGNVRLVRAGFSFSLDREQDVRWDATLAGGALYDVGCYTINLARMVVGEAPRRVWATAQWTPSGVDHTLLATLEYPGGALAQIACSFRASFQQQAQIVGNNGLIELDQAFTMHPHQETSIRLWRGNHFAEQETISLAAINHYRLEAEGFGRLIKAGHSPEQLPEMPLIETLDNLRTIEALLRSAREGHAIEL